MIVNRIRLVPSLVSSASSIHRHTHARARGRRRVRSRPRREHNHARAHIPRARRSSGTRDPVRVERVDSSFCFFKSRARAPPSRVARLPLTIERAQTLRRRASALTARRRDLVETLTRASRDVFARPDVDAPWRRVFAPVDTSWIDDDEKATRRDDSEDALDDEDDVVVRTRSYGRSLSTEGERAAAAATAFEPTIPWTASPSMRSSMEEDAATMEARGTTTTTTTPAETRGGAGEDARPSTSPATTSRSGRAARRRGDERARVASTPMPERRSVDAAAMRETYYARAMTARFTDGAPARVMFSDASEDSSTSSRLGVVVESADESRVYVFDVDADARTSTCVGSCVVAASNRRVARRRSSTSTSTRARASASADAIGMTPRGEFVVAADAEDGVCVLRVRSFERGRASSEDAATRLRCGFRATRVATTTDGDAFRLAVAGEPGRWATWTWTVSGDDDAFVLDEDAASFEELPPATFRGVEPKPGSPTTLRWLCGAADGESRLVVVVDGALLCAWDPRERVREKSAYAVTHAVREFVPVDPRDAERDGRGEAPVAALALAERKRGAFADLESTECSNDGSSSSENARGGTTVACALLRARDVTIGDAVFASAADDATSLACGRRGGVACFGARDGRVVAWNYLTGEGASVTSVICRDDEEENADEEENDDDVRSVAVARTSFAACARDRVSVFSLARDA